MGNTPYVIDVNEQDFQSKVLAKSYEVPVVVDFWAPWCGPCRMLGPVLEQLAEEFGGRFILAKVNTDQNQGLAMRYGIQGIPAVKAFRNGQIVAEFVGAQPKPVVRRFIEQLIPSPEDEKIAEAQRLASQGFDERAEALFREVLEHNPDHWDGALAFATFLVNRGRFDEAREVLARIPEETPQGQRAAQLLAEIAIKEQAAQGPGEDELRARLAENPDDVEAHFALASLLSAQERYDEALAEFLEVVKRDRSYKDDGARKAMLAIFEKLGDDHPLTQKYRSQLAMFLYA